MSRLSNAAIKGDIQRALAAGRKDLEKLVAETSGANSEPVKQAAFTLARRWRKTLSVPRAQLGPDLANAPPRMRTAKLRKSIRTAVVEGVRRVGTNSFVARLFEFGGYLVRQPKKGKAGNLIPQPPRPHASVALEQAKDAMTDVLVSEVQRRVPKGTVR